VKATLHLGRIGDVAVHLHASWFLVLVLMGWGLAAGVFPAEAPGWPPGVYLALATLTALVYLGSVLLHELGHAWVAAREGVPVQDVTLYFFGGVARLGPLPPSPGVRIRLASAGPLVNLLLAGPLGLAGLAGRSQPFIAEPAGWLVRTNLLLALLNLIPDLPLDGAGCSTLWYSTLAALLAAQIR